MAITVGTALDAFGFTKPTGPSEASTISSTETETESCYITVDYTGTYASGDDSTFNPLAVIQAHKRDGKTPVILGAVFCSAGLDSAGVIYGAGPTTAIVAGLITAPLTAEDLTTERADGAITAGDRPVCWLVTYHQPIE